MKTVTAVVSTQHEAAKLVRVGTTTIPETDWGWDSEGNLQIGPKMSRGPIQKLRRAVIVNSQIEFEEEVGAKPLEEALFQKRLPAA